jgi:hypothetical protein
LDGADSFIQFYDLWLVVFHDVSPSSFLRMFSPCGLNPVWPNPLM